MSILEEVVLKNKFEYKVERHGDVYVAEARNAHFNALGRITADLYLGRVVDKKPIKIWKPTWRNPFKKVPGEKEIQELELFVERLMIGCPSFGIFVDKLNKKLIYEQGQKISYENAEAFFLRAYEYYASMTKHILADK